MKYFTVLCCLVGLTACVPPAPAPRPLAYYPPPAPAPTPAFNPFNWPSVDPRVTVAGFKEGVTTMQDAVAALGKCGTDRPSEERPGQHNATWYFDHGKPNPEGVTVALTFGLDGKLVYKFIHTSYF